MGLFGFRGKDNKNNKPLVSKPAAMGSAAAPQVQSKVNPMIEVEKLIAEAAEGDIYALQKLYEMYSNPNTGRLDPSRARFWRRWEAQINNGGACYEMMEAYYKGDFVKKDLKAAYKFAVKARDAIYQRREDQSNEKIEAMIHRIYSESTPDIFSEGYYNMLRQAPEYDEVETEKLISYLQNPTSANRTYAAEHFATGRGVKKNEIVGFYICTPMNDPNWQHCNVYNALFYDMGVLVDLSVKYPREYVQTYKGIDTCNITEYKDINYYNVPFSVARYYAKLGGVFAGTLGNVKAALMNGYMMRTPVYGEQNEDEAIFYICWALVRGGNNPEIAGGYDALLTILEQNGKTSENFLDYLYAKAKQKFPDMYTEETRQRYMENKARKRESMIMTPEYVNAFLMGAVAGDNLERIMEAVAETGYEDFIHETHAKVIALGLAGPEYNINHAMAEAGKIGVKGRMCDLVKNLLLDEYNKRYMTVKTVLTRAMVERLMGYAYRTGQADYYNRIADYVEYSRMDNVYSLMAVVHAKYPAPKMMMGAGKAVETVVVTEVTETEDERVERQLSENRQKYGNWEGEPEIPEITDPSKRRPEYMELEKLVCEKDIIGILNRAEELYNQDADLFILATYFKEGALLGDPVALYNLAEIMRRDTTIRRNEKLELRIYDTLYEAGLKERIEGTMPNYETVIEALREEINIQYPLYDKNEFPEFAREYREFVKEREKEHDVMEEWLLNYIYWYTAELEIAMAPAGDHFNHELPHKYDKNRLDWDKLLSMPWTENIEKLIDIYQQDAEAAEGTFADKLVVSLDSSDEGRNGELPENLDAYFEGMIGMEEVKAQLDKIYQSVKMQLLREKILRERGEEPGESSKGYNFILLGNPGTGKTTVARIIAKILYDIGVRTSDSFVEIERSQVVSDHVGGTENRMREILDKIQGGTLFIDEAYALYREESDVDFGREAIDVLMKDMEDRRNSYSVIMAGYKEPMLNMIKNANSGFSSRFTYQIELPDYSDEALIEMAHQNMKKQAFIATNGVDAAIRKCIHHDKIDETFGNARYIRELVNRAIENQSHRLHESNGYEQEELFILRPEDFFAGTYEEKSVADYLKELDALTGLASVKEEVNSLISMIMVQKEMEKRGIAGDDKLGTLHMAFKGNPGTGKTTVARIIGNLYTALGILKRGDVFVECSRSDLVAEYQGQTAVKVKKVVQSAMGGILFVDEAYSLVQSEGDTFGHEAVDMLVSEMENNRDNLVVIFAGYSNDIDRFFQNNQGLRSRVPKDLVFEDYTDNELFEIAMGMCVKKNMTCTDEAKEALKKRLTEERAANPNFGNARGVRNIIDAVVRKQNVRISKMMQENSANITNEIFTILEKEDVISESTVVNMTYKE